MSFKWKSHTVRDSQSAQNRKLTCSAFGHMRVTYNEWSTVLFAVVKRELQRAGIWQHEVSRQMESRVKVDVQWPQHVYACVQ